MNYFTLQDVNKYQNIPLAYRKEIKYSLSGLLASNTNFISHS